MPWDIVNVSRKNSQIFYTWLRQKKNILYEYCVGFSLLHNFQTSVRKAK